MTHISPSSPRRLARELALQALYALESGEASSPERVFDELAETQELSEKNKKFAYALFSLTEHYAEWADGVIAELAEHWKLERIATIDRTILRMALVELEHIPETPVKVILNEAIELARKYSTSESPSFVNGVLDAYLKRMKEKDDKKQ